jgi:formate hydrogenlyase subunit 3/multisubunit Na+/H+ antiporter MnhD subunit
MYEFFLFPSIFIVYNYSPNLRFLATNIYFIMWTQVGSVLIILVTVFLFLKCGTLYFYDLQKPLSFTTSLCLLIGFGVKIPM